jgi:nitrogen regulatory protein PII
MSNKENSVKPTVLLTIICESVLRQRIVQLLKSKGASGYTINDVLGEGGHGRRLGDIPGFNTNIEVKTLISIDVSDEIIQGLSEMRKDHALIAFQHEVDALIY